MAARKDEKERLRQSRQQAEAQERSQERKRLLLGYAVAGVITLAVLAGIVAVIASGGDEGPGGGIDAGEHGRVDVNFGDVPDGIGIDDRDSADPPGGEDLNVVPGDVSSLRRLADEAGCELLLDQEDEGNRHIPLEDGRPDYDASPPTSGDHFGTPLADGAFLDRPSPLYYVHSLEHGRIVIHYSPELPESEQLELLGLFDESRPGIIIFPSDRQPYLLAATAWRNTIGCDSYEGAATLDAIRAFRVAFRGFGPEAVALE